MIGEEVDLGIVAQEGMQQLKGMAGDQVDRKRQNVDQAEWLLLQFRVQRTEQKQDHEQQSCMDEVEGKNAPKTASKCVLLNT